MGVTSGTLPFSFLQLKLAINETIVFIFMITDDFGVEILTCPFPPQKALYSNQWVLILQLLCLAKVPIHKEDFVCNKILNIPFGSCLTHLSSYHTH